MKEADQILKWIFVVLILAGLFILASASIGISATLEFPSYYFILRQLLIGGIAGGLAFFVAYRISYQRWRFWAPGVFILGLLATAAVFLPKIGLEYGGARRWLALGPFTFQPAEFLKFGFILYLSAWFSSRSSHIRSFANGFVPFAVIVALSGVLFIFQPDIGTLGVMVLSGLLLYSLAGARLHHILFFVLLGVLFLLALIYLEPYRLERFLVFINPNYDPQGSGYQLRQALIAIGSGGILGRGFGMSRQKFQYLPEPVGDAIFAVFAEEFGFIGAVLLLVLFILFAWRGLYIASKAPDIFGKLFGSGIVILIVAQSLVNIAAMTGVFPLTGIPLIFISQGGSALLMAIFEVGILLNISKSRSW